MANRSRPTGFAILLAACGFALWSGPLMAGPSNQPEMTPPIVDQNGEIAPRSVNPPDESGAPEASPEATSPDDQEMTPPIVGRQGEIPPHPLGPGADDITGPQGAPDQDQAPPQPGADNGQDTPDLMGGDLADPAQRKQALDDFYGQLATAKTAEAAQPIEQDIEQIWNSSGSDTIDLLMTRAQGFIKGNDLDLAGQVLDAVVELAPDDAEAWHRRALLHYMQKDYDQALADLKHALALDPKHYAALEGLGSVLEALGDKKGALAAYRQALQVNPFLDAVKQSVDQLKHQVEGQDI